MAAASGANRASFEVHCANCQVTFPVETRVCLHCGGPTTQATYDSAYSADYTTADAGYTERAIEPTNESPFSYGQADVGGARPAGEPLEGEDGSEAPVSLGRSLMRSLGGIIWVLLLIGYSFAQNCGE